MLETLPESLLLVPSLVKLSLADNMIESLPELGRATWPFLQFLSLNSNCLKALPASLCNLVSLKGLSFEKNNIEQEPPALGSLRSRLLVLRKREYFLVKETPSQYHDYFAEMSGNAFLKVNKSEPYAAKRMSRAARMTCVPIPFFFFVCPHLL